MSELIVIGYDSASRAEAARDALLGMEREYLVDVADAVVATSDSKGRVQLSQMVNLWTVGASGGALWGLLVGVLFLTPLLGVAVGAGAGALGAAFSDYGIDDTFMKGVAETLQPNQAALFMLVRPVASDRVIERLGKTGGRILRTNLDSGKEAALRAAFEAAHARAARPAQHHAA